MQDNFPSQSLEKSYELLIQSVTDYAIFMLDPQGYVVNWNSGASRIKGYSAKEIVGSHFSRFYTPEDQAAGVPARALETARVTGRYEDEAWRRRKDGTLFRAAVVIDAIKDSAGGLLGFAKITRDVTERYQAQKQLEATREQLVRVHKMESLGQLTGGMAHDFNNLLTAIIGNAELGRRHCDDGSRQARCFENILKAAQRGGAITKQLLSFARRQSLAPELVDLNRRLATISQLVRHSLQSETILVSEHDCDLWCVEVDPGQLELALVNLALNARDAMGEGGTVRLSAKNVVLDREFENLAGDYVAISVSDSGCGIPIEIRDRVVEPFFTTKGFGRGMGLGLSQVYGFAKQSGGALDFDSEVGRGTTVTLFLPASVSDVMRRMRNGADRRLRVLLVEDDVMVAELGQDLIAELGFDVVTAHNASDALMTLQRDPAFDLIFSDIVMPGGMSGIELVRKVRLRLPEIPILLTTGFSDALSSRGIEFPVISKPYTLDEVRAAIEKALSLPVIERVQDPPQEP